MGGAAAVLSRRRWAALGGLLLALGLYDALAPPDIDESLDEQAAKTRYWNALKALGPWWAEQPPY